MNRIKIFIILITVVVSCEVDYSTRFSEITERDIEGNLVGSVDETDWKFDDEWTRKEEALFSPDNFDPSKKSEIIRNSASIIQMTDPSIIAYPNPATTMINLSIESGADTIKFVLVNEHFDIVTLFRHAEGTSNITIDLSYEELEVDSYIRLYYQLLYGDGTIEKGHGDILITE